MDVQTFLPENKYNPESEQYPSKEQIYSTPNSFSNQNNNNAPIYFKPNDMEPAQLPTQSQSQVIVYPQYAPGLIQPRQLDFSQYSNINQIYHRRINQINNNTFNITKSINEKVIKIFPVIFWIIIGIVFLSIWASSDELPFLIVGILGFLMAIFFLIILILFQHSINFILGKNNITVEELYYCRKKITSYIPGQLSKVELTCIISNCNTKYNYSINFKSTRAYGDKAYFEESSNCGRTYTDEEIGYFNYVINRHIETNMMSKTAK